MPQPHILIVDDDLALLQALPETLQLRMGGVTVHTTDSAEAALARIAVTDYDAIVCDIKMPGVDELALLAEIRAVRPHTPTLLITGHGEHDLPVQALRGGAYDFMQKPIDREYFVASLHRAIQMRQLSRQVEEQRLALERRADALEHMLEARTRQLLEANRAKDELLALLDTAEEQIQRALNEKEILLQELHHRVKNNLQIICSLLYLQSIHTRDVQARELFAESQRRVRSMGLIHESLYRSGNLARIDVANYIHNLCTHLMHSYGVHTGRIRLDLRIDEDSLSLDVAIPCGLILNELVSNCLKHAFPAGQAGEISIEFRSDYPRHFVLIVGDNGVGLPAEVDIHHTDTLGLQLVSTLIHQLDGRIELDRHRGTTFTIAFGEPTG